MKIRIIGPCGSGKSTLAKELSEKYTIPYYEIDHIIWDRASGNVKYPEMVRDATLKSIVDSDAWIVEGVQYKEWTLASIEQADLVVILSPNVFVRDYRIIKRFILSRTGIRPWNYNQSFKNVCKMIVRWNHQYDMQQAIDISNRCNKRVCIASRTREVICRIEEQITR